MSFWPTKGNRQKMNFSLAPMKDTCLSSAWFGQQKVQFPETKKKEKKNNAPLLALPNCRSASVLEP
jgi:hypothetical protein